MLKYKTEQASKQMYKQRYFLLLYNVVQTNSEKLFSNLNNNQQQQHQQRHNQQ